MTIRQLPETIINQIAAGEVIERPASVVKEFLENSIDADARRIDISTSGGGLSRIVVIDDGTGIAADALPLAIGRHCTSKLSDNIFDIHSLGFRGEALPSIGAVSRLTVTSRQEGHTAYRISVAGGAVGQVQPASGVKGTMVEARELFYNVPARLKFMRSHRAENAAIGDVVRRLGLAYPDIHFCLSGDDRTTLDLARVPRSDPTARIGQIFGREFLDNCVEVDAERDGVHLSGFVSIPAFHRNNSLYQFAYVNDRPVRDKLVSGAIRGAYADLMVSNRYPMAVLFFRLDPALVDVNVHPAKADVRFRDPGLVRGLIIGSIREALGRERLRSNTQAASAMASVFRTAQGESGPPNGFADNGQAPFAYNAGPGADLRAAMPEDACDTEAPLGAARAQVHENYIVAQTRDSLVIVDQHAAHERIVYEKMKAALHGKRLPSQLLLVPDIIEMKVEDVDRLCERAEELAQFGLVLERFGPGAVSVRETPSMLGEVDSRSLVQDLADELNEIGEVRGLKERIDRLAATLACHGSVRSGRRLRPEEMNALLRSMESTPGAGTCNHGRPTYIELKLSDIERLFGRR